MASDTPATSLLLTETEANILSLYDQLRELQLQLALLKSQQGQDAPDRNTPVAEPEMRNDRVQLLETKAILSLRDSVVENVVAAQPTLDAVHRATHASPIERDLLPYTEQRDEAAVRAAKTCSELRGATGRLTKLEAEILRASHRNIKLASEALQLAGEPNDQGPSNAGGGRFGREMTTLEGQMRASRRRWRVMKGTASAIVAGSGIEWARHKRLRDLVLDPLD